MSWETQTFEWFLHFLPCFQVPVSASNSLSTLSFEAVESVYSICHSSSTSWACNTSSLLLVFSVILCVYDLLSALFNCKVVVSHWVQQVLALSTLHLEEDWIGFLPADWGLELSEKSKRYLCALLSPRQETKETSKEFNKEKNNICKGNRQTSPDWIFNQLPSNVHSLKVTTVLFCGKMVVTNKDKPF